ncbi:AraC family transcriptional regulator [Pedobacter sp. KBW06]|uniref:AraC family transcriptional regulator n=1 Tax=Pedobacter sp. KBW06 TaxID=2153359 RepID=UPI000F59EDE2|nr:AraC family transcriptional regulator [Pedobacter sp. KBW06]RQO75472.1 AraC family transcriptional regulator [Pedobacter sp. KBW06]
MKRFIQHEALFIRHFSTLKWPFPLHNHDHFELVFIHSGKGRHYHNQIEQFYEGRSLFLLAPEDAHIFDIQEETSFSVLKFNNIYLEGFSNEKTTKDWGRLIDQLLAISATYDSRLVKSEDDLEKIDQLMLLIVREWQSSLSAANEVIFHLIRAVFSILKKNAINDMIPEQSSNGHILVSVVAFIHAHIQQPELLKMSNLSAHFNFSPNYLSSLFKRQMNVSIKQYIDDYKFKVIESLLNPGNATKKEISYKFGFSDLSHFNKFLKKYSQRKDVLPAGNDNGAIYIAHLQKK